MQLKTISNKCADRRGSGAFGPGQVMQKDYEMTHFGTRLHEHRMDSGRYQEYFSFLLRHW